MHPFEVNRVDRIFLTLKPIAWNFGEDNLAKAVLPRERLPIRNKRRGLRPKICPYQSGQRFHGIRLDANLVFESCLGCGDVIEWLLDAAASLIEPPAVLIAAKAACFDESI